MKVVENKSYFDRLLFYQGLKKETDLVNVEKATDLEIATVGYGLGNWHLYNGDCKKAEDYFRRIVSGKYWPAFGLSPPRRNCPGLGSRIGIRSFLKNIGRLKAGLKT